MSALTVLIIRHGEKPDRETNAPPWGVDVDGAEHRHSLIVRGWQRAGAWAALFGSGRGGNDYPKPAIVYAAKPVGKQDQEADDDAGRAGRRPLETITPLADRLKQAANVDWTVGEEAQLVENVVKQTGIVLICWEHRRIWKAIVPILLDGQRPVGLPDKWDDARFDVVWRFDRTAPDAAWSFRLLEPALLAGDLGT
jgi:hypothetical protein